MIRSGLKDAAEWFMSAVDLIRMIIKGCLIINTTLLLFN